MKRSPSLSVLSVLPVLSVFGCATSPADQDLRGLPQIRTVTTGAMTTGGGQYGSGLAIRFVDDPVLVEEVVGAPQEEVLPLLADAFRAEGLPPDGMVPESGVVSLSRAEWFRELNHQPLSEFLDCGSSSMGRPLVENARISSAITAQAIGEGSETTRVTIRLDAVASPSSTVGGRVQGCTTTGVLERAILDRIQTALAPEEVGPTVEVGPRVQGTDVGTGLVASNPSSRLGAGEPLFEPGDDIRIWLSSSERLTGVFMGYDAGSLLLKRSRRQGVPLWSIQSLQVKRTRRLPVLVGGVLGIATGVFVAMNTELGITGRQANQGKILNPGLGAVFGGLAGAGFSYFFFGRSWLDVPPEGVWLETSRQR